MLRIASVQYDTGYTKYDFLTDIEGVKKGDVVVVDSSNGLGLATVKEFKPLSIGTATKWIVCKVDMQAHQDRVEKMEKLAEIKGRLERKRRQFDVMQQYKIMAETDEEVANMLKELKELENGGKEIF